MPAALDGVEAHRGGPVGAVVVADDSAGCAEIAEVRQSGGRRLGADAIALREIGRSRRRRKMLTPRQMPVNAHRATVESGQRVGGAVHRHDRQPSVRVMVDVEIVGCGLGAADDGCAGQKFRSLVNQPDRHLPTQREPDHIDSLGVCPARNHVRNERPDESDMSTLLVFFDPITALRAPFQSRCSASG